MTDDQIAVDTRGTVTATTMPNTDHDEWRRLARAATPGPWKVYESENPCTYEGGQGYPFIERQIGTVAEHPQLHAPAPIVTLATGLMERPMVSMGPADAAYIAHSSPDRVLALLEENAALQADVSGQRMCLTCGQRAPSGVRRTYQHPACTGPDGYNPCLFDHTPEEAWQHWRQIAHDQAARIHTLEAAIRAHQVGSRDGGGSDDALWALVPEEPA